MSNSQPCIYQVKRTEYSKTLYSPRVYYLKGSGILVEVLYDSNLQTNLFEWTLFVGRGLMTADGRSHAADPEGPRVAARRSRVDFMGVIEPSSPIGKELRLLSTSAISTWGKLIPIVAFH